MRDRIAESLELLVCCLELCGPLYNPLLEFFIELPDGFVGSFPVTDIIYVCKESLLSFLS
jgi:hypothetical protein